MSARPLASAPCCWSGGKSRVGDPAADGADGPLELDPVGVDAGRRGGGADQGADRVVGQEVAPDLLLDHVRGLGAQDAAGAAGAWRKSVMVVTSVISSSFPPPSRSGT